MITKMLYLLACGDFFHSNDNFSLILRIYSVLFIKKPKQYMRLRYYFNMAVISTVI